MDDKYNVKKSKKPVDKSEEIQFRIEELVRQRDAETDPARKETLHTQIMTLFAQYQRSKL